MTMLLQVTPTTSSAANVTNWAQYRAGDGIPPSIAGALVATWNSTQGATFSAILQTTFDGGVTAIDIAAFSLTTGTSTTISRKGFNLSSMTPVTTQASLTDNGLGSSTAQDGMLGSQYRVKWGTTGTYDGVTSFRLDVNRRLFTLSSTASAI